MKVCSKCKVTQPETDFHKSKHNTDGLCCSCKSCKRIARKRYYALHAEEAKAYTKNWDHTHYPECKARLLRARPYQEYKKDTCADCGFIAKHLAQMDVHHIDKNHNNNNEPKNLITLCANCHRLKHVGKLED